MLHRPHDALPYLREAIAIDADSDTTINNLIYTLLNLGQLEEALIQANDVTAKYPDSPSGYLMRGFVQTQLAQTKSAMESFERCWQLEQTAAIAVSNALFTLLYRDDLNDEEYLQQLHTWVDRLPQPKKTYQQWRGEGDLNPDRRLKIGYLSGDLRSHPVSFFLEPILANHDQTQVEVYCYDTTPLRTRPRTRRHFQ